MKTLNCGPITLGERPAVAVAIQAPEDPSAIAAAYPGAIVELRLDALPDPTPDACTDFVARYDGFPRLATIRHHGEGGGWKGGEEARLACFEAVLPRVDMVDVEITSGEITESVVARAHALGKVVIGSFHDFEATPEDHALEAVQKRGRALGVDIVKVAARCATPEDAQRLAAFTLRHRDEGIIVVGMGPYGTASRVFFPALGSLVTYTFLGKPTAPGQLNCQDTLKYLRDFYPQGVAGE